MSYVYAPSGVIAHYPIEHHYRIKQLFPNVSFPRPLTDEMLAAFDVYPVVRLEPPAYDAATQDLVQNTVPTLVDGEWQIGYTVVDLTPEQITERLTAYKAQVQAHITAQVQDRMDAFAATRNYHNMLSACTYATSTNPTFAAEGQRCVELRDATWAALYGVLAEVEAGTRAIPADITDVEAELPILTWST
jgi:hypothetical protein